MSGKSLCTAAAVILFTVGGLAAVAEEPRIAVLDIQSTSMEEGQTSVLTDIFRTELFKTNLFQIIEQTQVQQVANVTDGVTSRTLELLADELEVDSIMVMNLERLGQERLVFNVRIINVPGLVLVYTENFFLPSEDHLFETLVELTQRVQRFFTNGESGDEYGDTVRWRQLGASLEQIELFEAHGLTPDDYIGLRQYDISFDISDFENAIQNSWDLDTIRAFLQAEISYYLVKQAFSMGLFSLDHYRASFRPAGFSFYEYLDAYERNIMSPDNYRSFRGGFRQDHLLAGIGGVADDFPIANAEFSYPLVRVGWEHYWTQYQRGLWKASSEVGLKFLLIAPAPYLQGNFYIGNAPYYFKIGGGVAAELLLGGHVGGYTSIGIEVLERFEMSLLTTWAGTQPYISYTDFETKRDEPGYTGLRFPYFGIVFSMKFTDLFF
ncbi:MAG: hypothetical protein ACOCVC_01125 [Spirochaeta sp.]